MGKSFHNKAFFEDFDECEMGDSSYPTSSSKRDIKQARKQAQAERDARRKAQAERDKAIAELNEEM